MMGPNVIYLGSSEVERTMRLTLKEVDIKDNTVIFVGDRKIIYLLRDSIKEYIKSDEEKEKVELDFFNTSFKMYWDDNDCMFFGTTITDGNYKSITSPVSAEIISGQLEVIFDKDQDLSSLLGKTYEDVVVSISYEKIDEIREDK